MKRSNAVLYVSAFLSLLVTLVVFNRWIFTALKEKSFGRVWQYYLSYRDFGFYRRGLLGTVLTETGLNQSIANEYLFSYFFYGFGLVFCYAIFVYFFKINKNLIENNRLVIGVFLSPVLFSHFAHSTGSNDLFLFIIFACLIFYVSNRVIFTILVVAGLLIHDLFIFMLPGLLALKHLTDARYRLHISNAPLMMAIAMACIAIVMIVFFGRLTVDQATFEQVMAQKIPNAAYQHALWSGYFETSSSVNENYGNHHHFLTMVWENRWMALLPTAYAIFVAWMVAQGFSSKRFHQLALWAALIFPLCTQWVAADYYRWVSISAAMSIVGLCIGTAKGMMHPPKRMLACFVVFIILTPFGGTVVSLPFPLHQFAIEKLRQ